MSTDDTARSDEQAQVEGVYAPRCPRCGWQAVERPYTDASRDAMRAAAQADVAEHRVTCRPRLRPGTLGEEDPR